MFSISETEFFFQVTFIALLLGAAIMDLRAFRISNDLSLAVLATGFLYQLAFGSIVMAGLVAFIFFSIGFCLYLFRCLGAGDVKLLSASAVFLGPELAGQFTLIVAASGGVMAIFWSQTGLFRKALVYYGAVIDPDVPKNIPYGVPICAGGILTMLPILLP